LNAVDGRQDRLVRGGPGKDVCRVDATDQASVKGCETVKIASGEAPGGGPRGSQSCVHPPEEATAGGPARAAGDVPPTFSDPLYAIAITLNASADGLDGDELPISIEEVCDVPKGLESEAASSSATTGSR